jgi:hypothetical protein
MDAIYNGYFFIVVWTLEKHVFLTLTKGKH